MKLMATLRSGAGVMWSASTPAPATQADRGTVAARALHRPGAAGLARCCARHGPGADLHSVARVADNAYLGTDYVRRPQASGARPNWCARMAARRLVRRLRPAFFPEFSADRHIMAPRALPVLGAVPFVRLGISPPVRRSLVGGL